MAYGVIVIGGGPAGLSAAVNARARGSAVLVVSNPPEENPLWRAEKVDNYLGLPGLTGPELMAAFRDHAARAGAEFMEGRALSALRSGEDWYVGVGDSMVQGRAVVLAAGVVRGKKFPGEAELLGRGVSYCATCDGMFYRGKRVVCAGDAPNFDEEAEFLRSIGCQVEVKRLAGLSILGEDGVTGVRDAKGEETPCGGVFLLRSSIAPARLVPGLETEGGYIKVDGRMATSLPGVYAAGDCTGQPLQLAKAAGQGQIAAHSAIEDMGREG